MTIYRTEYYEEKIGKWISIWTTTDVYEAMEYITTPIIGNPLVRVAKYEKTGIRKIKYKYLETVFQSNWNPAYNLINPK